MVRFCEKCFENGSKSDTMGTNVETLQTQRSGIGNVIQTKTIINVNKFLLICSLHLNEMKTIKMIQTILHKILNRFG